MEGTGRRGPIFAAAGTSERVNREVFAHQQKLGEMQVKHEKKMAKSKAHQQGRHAAETLQETKRHHAVMEKSSKSFWGNLVNEPLSAGSTGELVSLWCFCFLTGNFFEAVLVRLTTCLVCRFFRTLTNRPRSFVS